jgi:uncharacterized delta-60 repeat protein
MNFISKIFFIVICLLIMPGKSFSQAGRLDTTFGESGIVRTDINNSTFVMSVKINGDGKILAVGYSENENDEDFAVSLYNPEGILDTTFGKNGIVNTPIGNSEDRANSAVIQDDGKIIAAGNSNNGSNDDFAIARYNMNGTLDSTFGTNGIVITPIGTSDDAALSVISQKDKKIIAAGYSDKAKYRVFAIVRYNIDGTLDKTFGENGIVTTPVGTSDDVAYSSTLQTDGKIVVAGYSYYPSKYDDDYKMVRLNPDGTLDNSFGKNGIITSAKTSNEEFNSVAIQKDGKIVTAGYLDSGDNALFAITRFNPDGTLDNTFGTDGIATKHFDTSSDDYAKSIKVQSNGKIVVAGYTIHNIFKSAFAIARYNPNGSLDNTFGENGINTLHINTNPSYDFAKAYSIAFQRNGKIIVAGHAEVNNNYTVAIIARYTGDSPTGVFQEISNEPNSYMLKQNYPNPFNPSTKISYSLPKSGFVTLNVYNLLGQKVAELVNEKQHAGNYEATFNAGSLPSGIYIYKIITNTYTNSRKMILIK